MGKGRKKSKEIKKEIKRKNLVKVLVSRGMELNDAIIESHRQIRNGSVKVKLKRMKKHYDNAKECKGTRKKMEKAKRKRNRRKSPLISIGFEYKKWQVYMGRLTDFISYINEEYEPIPLDKKAIFVHILFTDKVQEARRKYRKRI